MRDIRVCEVVESFNWPRTRTHAHAGTHLAWRSHHLFS